MSHALVCYQWLSCKVLHECGKLTQHLARVSGGFNLTFSVLTNLVTIAMRNILNNERLMNN